MQGKYSSRVAQKIRMVLHIVFLDFVEYTCEVGGGGQCHRSVMVGERTPLVGAMPFPLFYCPARKKMIHFNCEGFTEETFSRYARES